MTKSPPRASTGARFLDRVVARWTAFAKPATGFVSQPEPRTVGSFARGRQLVAGNFLFAGHLIEDGGDDLWALESPGRAFTSDLHGFAWLDDLAAVADATTRQRAQKWLWEWIDHFGRGSGPGWVPDLTGRRLIRWINHAFFILRGQDKAAHDAFYRSLAHQTLYLARRWKSEKLKSRKQGWDRWLSETKPATFVTPISMPPLMTRLSSRRRSSSLAMRALW